MTSTSSQLGPDFIKQAMDPLFNAINEGTKQSAQMLWDIMMAYLAQHLIAVIVGLVAIFFIALIRTFITGRWAMLGSVSYNYLYFGTLFFVGLFFGPEVFTSDYFKIFLAVLYLICFALVGIFLRKIGVRRL